MGLTDVGNLQTGLNADSSYAALNGQVLVPVGGYLPIGYPVARNITSIQGNYLSRFAALPGFSSFANGDNFVSLPLSGFQTGATLTTGASISGGVYAGPPVGNPWLAQPAGTLNTQPLQQQAILARSGYRLALVGVANGGTAVKVGDFVTKGATLGTTSLAPYLISSGPSTWVSGNTVGQVCQGPIWTSLGAALTAPGTSQVAQPWSTNGITTATPITINPGQSNQETVTPTAVTATSPAVSTLTVAGTAGSASTVQLTFNVSGYQGSAGLTGPTGTLTTIFTLLIPIVNGATATIAAQTIVSAVNASGFAFGAPQNIYGIGAGSFIQSGTAAGTPQNGPLVYAQNSAGVITFSAAMPGIWANTLLTYTITVLTGTTQTFNTNVAGSATAVAFASGVNGAVTATFANAHAIGEPIIGVNNIINTSDVGATIIPVPGTTGMQNVGLVYVDTATQ
jgi:hypothetical protein